MKRNPFISTFLAFLLITSLTVFPAFAQEQTEEKKTKELKAVAEDELAPVKALQAAIKERLAKPVKTLDLDLIMEGENFFGAQPRIINWDSDGKRIWFSWKKWNEDERGTYEYVIGSDAPTRLSKDEEDLVPPGNAQWNDDRSLAMWTVRGSVMLYDGATKTTTVLIANFRGARLMGFSSDSKSIFFSFRDNVYAFALTADGAAMRVLTDIRSGTLRDDEPKTDNQKWLKQQQLALFDVLNRRHKQRIEREERDKNLAMKPFYLSGWTANRLFPSGDGSYIAVAQTKETKSNRLAEMPSYVTESGYTETRKIRNKVGDARGKQRISIINSATGDSAHVDFGLEKRDISFFGVQWSPDGKHGFVQLRAWDNKDRWIAVLTPGWKEAEGEDKKFEVTVNLVAGDHDDAWINWRVAGSNGWLPDNSGIYFLTERTGQIHLYSVPVDGGEAKALTSGDFNVWSATLTSDEKNFVLGASLDGNPHVNQTFMLPVAGGGLEQLTSGFGRADSTVSPDGNSIAFTASSDNIPWELFVRDLKAVGAGTKVTDSPSPAYKSYDWTAPEVEHFVARDGVKVPVQFYRSATPHPNKPGVVFVHGAGYMQNVHHWWRGASYGRVYAFHHMLMEQGYTVIDIDYRGSAGYDRQWRTAIYQHMGGTDLTDQVDGVKYMVEKYGVDPKRIGLYGGSYGGFITLMAMFLEPDVFAAGGSMRPVTDWSAYNHSYTSNILNTPQDDPESYLKSSPIYFAEGLKGALLICHGIVDDNVHFQDSVRLVQRLIELRKDNWELAMYPVERHGFVEPASWVDEYRRILKLFDDNLKNK